jgi:hypothetical protein
MLGGKGKGGRVGQLESPSGTELSPCLRVANLQKIFFCSVIGVRPSSPWRLPPPLRVGAIGARTSKNSQGAGAVKTLGA